MSHFIEKIKHYLFKNSKWNGECLETTYKKKSKKRSPQLCINKKCISIHRASWMIHHGEIPIGMCVLHRCDNPNCFRIDHLFLGTLSDNMKDMVNKKRDNTFGRRKYSQFDFEIAKILREKGCTYREIAYHLNAKESAISAFFNRDKKKKNNCQDNQ